MECQHLAGLPAGSRRSIFIHRGGHPRMMYPGEMLVVLQTSFVEFASSDAKGGHLRMPYSSSVKLTLLNY